MARRKRVKAPPSCSEPEKKLHGWMRERCLKIINTLIKKRGARYWFTQPVDPIKMGLSDYNEIVKKPMDLGTVKRNLNRGLYDKAPTEFAADVKLTFDNAQLFNPKGHIVHDLADKLMGKFEKLYFPLYREYDRRRRGLIGDDEKEEVRKWMEEWLVVRKVKETVVSIVKERNRDMVLNEDPLKLDWGLLDRETLTDLDNALG